VRNPGRSQETQDAGGKRVCGRSFPAVVLILQVRVDGFVRSDRRFSLSVGPSIAEQDHTFGKFVG
jgi:hypothetical protein